MIGRKRSNVRGHRMVLAIAGLVLQRHEDGVAGAGTLPHQHEAGDGHASARDDVGQTARAGRCRARRDRRAGTTPDAPSATDAGAGNPRSPAGPAASAADPRPARAPAMATRLNSGRSSLSPARRSARTAHSASRRLKPSERKASACASFSSAAGFSRVRSQRSRTESKPSPRTLSMVLASSSEKPLICRKPRRSACVVRISSAHARHGGDAARSAGFRARRLQRAIPIRQVHIHRPHLDAMLLRVAHDLRRRVEAHRLAVEQRGGEHIRIVAFDPGGDIDEVREARGVAFGKAVFAEALDLLPSSARRIRDRSRARSCRR